MTAIIYIIAYLLLICEIVWWFTSVDRSKFPLLLELVIVFVCCIPGLHVFVAFAGPAICTVAYEGGDLELKDNWFNRKFLNHE